LSVVVSRFRWSKGAATDGGSTLGSHETALWAALPPFAAAAAAAAPPRRHERRLWGAVGGGTAPLRHWPPRPLRTQTATADAPGV